MELNKISIKIFSDDPKLNTPRSFTPLFHRWIQQQGVADHLLVDVADYSHVHHGPGILLMAHEGHYSLDQSSGKPGLLYARNQPLSGTLAERLKTVWHYTILAAQQFERDTQVTFDYWHYRIIANDRLAAPNSNQTFQAFSEAIAELATGWNLRDWGIIQNTSAPKGRLEIDWTLRNSVDPKAIFSESEGVLLC